MTSYTFRVWRKSLLHMWTVGGTNARPCFNVRVRGEVRRREDRKACPANPAAWHVIVGGDIDKVCSSESRPRNGSVVSTHQKMEMNEVKSAVQTWTYRILVPGSVRPIRAVGCLICQNAQKV